MPRRRRALRLSLFPARSRRIASARRNEGEGGLPTGESRRTRGTRRRRAANVAVLRSRDEHGRFVAERCAADVADRDGPAAERSTDPEPNGVADAVGVVASAGTHGVDEPDEPCVGVGRKVAEVGEVEVSVRVDQARHHGRPGRIDNPRDVADVLAAFDLGGRSEGDDVAGHRSGLGGGVRARAEVRRRMMVVGRGLSERVGGGRGVDPDKFTR